MNIINSTVTFFGQTELSNNSAGDAGGAIQLSYSILKMNGLVDVSDNWVTKKYVGRQVQGGAINSIQSNITMSGFMRNRIHVPFLGLGGAICAQNCRPSMISGEFLLLDNDSGMLLSNTSRR